MGYIDMLNQTSHINLWLNCGSRTNTKGDLLGIWISLHYANVWNINLKQVVGESLLIVNWAKKQCSIHEIHLQTWLDLTLDLLGHFQIFLSYISSKDSTTKNQCTYFRENMMYVILDQDIDGLHLSHMSTFINVTTFR